MDLPGVHRRSGIPLVIKCSEVPGTFKSIDLVQELVYHLHMVGLIRESLKYRLWRSIGFDT